MQMNTDATALICGTNLKFIAIRPPYNRCRVQLLAKQFELRPGCNLLVEEELGRQHIAFTILLHHPFFQQHSALSGKENHGILFHIVLQNVPHIFNLAALLLSFSFSVQNGT